MNTVLITRSGKKGLGNLKSFIDRISPSPLIKKIYYVSERKDKDIDNNPKVEFVEDKNSKSPTAINRALKRLEKEKERPDAFLVCSKEVGLGKKDIEILVGELENNLKSLLVVGYKFQIKIKEDKKLEKDLNRELEQYYAKKDLIAYRVPWNTCAIWNHQLFFNEEYGVKKFDEITDRKTFPPLLVRIDNKCEETKYRGMEDGLAIAKAASRFKGGKNLFKLLSKRLDWEVEEDKVDDHRKKLARKEIVLRVFMEVRGYSVEDLESSEKQ